MGLAEPDIQTLMNAHVAPLWGVANVGALVVPNHRYTHAGAATPVTQSNAPVQLDVLDTAPGSSVAYVRDQLFHYAYQGAGIRAYTIDTGIIPTHSEFGTRAHAWINTVNGGSPLDGHGHGTHVASLIGGATFGVAKAVVIYAVKALDNDGYGTVASVCDGAVAVQEECAQTAADGPIVINLSLNGPKSSAIDSALATLSQQCSCAIAVAAGNNGVDACGSSPAGQQQGVLTVGAHDLQGMRASFSNYGTCVDLYAMGVNVPGAALPSGMIEMSGTSMTSPQVAGLCALFQEKNLAAASGVVSPTMGATSMANVMTAAGPRGGRANMGSAATGTTPPPPPPPAGPAPKAPVPPPPQGPAPKPPAKAGNPIRKSSDASMLDIGWAIGVALMVLLID
jgi:subtilisin family serine protease